MHRAVDPGQIGNPTGQQRVHGSAIDETTYAEVVRIADGDVEQRARPAVDLGWQLAVSNLHGVDSMEPASSGVAGTFHTVACRPFVRSQRTTSYGESAS